MRAWREDELFRRSRRVDARADARIDDNGADVIAARPLHTDHNDSTTSRVRRTSTRAGATRESRRQSIPPSAALLRQGNHIARCDRAADCTPVARNGLFTCFDRRCACDAWICGFFSKLLSKN
jgi:hypothetical protein